MTNQSNEAIIIIKKDGKETVLDERTVRLYTEELIEYLLEEVRSVKDFGKNTKLVQQLIEIKKAYWPATLKSITADVTVPFEKQVEQFLALRKEQRELEKDGT